MINPYSAGLPGELSGSSGATAVSSHGPRIDASMIIGIFHSYLNRIDKRRHFQDVLLRVASTLVVVVGGGVAVFLLVHHYEGSSFQTYFETATYLLAAGAFTYMNFGMQRYARTLTKERERRSNLALSGGTRASFGILTFQVVVWIVYVWISTTAFIQIGHRRKVDGQLRIRNCSASAQTNSMLPAGDQ